ncbi:hypothetical protein E4U42_007026 [Claviceps africana]|uniref:Uncharacterized protein n=1 Tax=Claviceps africana TaxID=83212 RepID=A0A8K0JBI9_9HYPO|nr:hypothetical protein E4U42_007026 [Claviceps africana]
MDQIGAKVKREQHEAVKTALVPAVETSQTTVTANMMFKDYIDLTGDEDDDHGFDEPRPIKAELEAIPDVVEVNGCQPSSTQSPKNGEKNTGLGFTDSAPTKAEPKVTPEAENILSSLPKPTGFQDAWDKIDNPGVSAPRPMKAEPEVILEVVEISSPQLKLTKIKDIGGDIDNSDFTEPRPIKADLAVTPDIEGVSGSQPSSTICLDTEDDDLVLLSRANITKELEPRHSEIQSAALIDTISNLDESDAHSTNSDSSESEIDDEDKDKTYEEGHKRSGKKKKMHHRPPAKTAREFFARLQEKQKTCKTKQVSGRGKAPKKSAMKATSDLGTVAQLQQDLVNGESIRDEPTTTMPEMSTHTHAEQLAIMYNSIPAGSDYRRTQTQKRDLRQAKKSFGHRAIKAVNGGWQHRDMETALYNHQLTATQWMMERELVKSGPDGGILADEMGMGKTLMSLACVVGNPPEEAYIKKFGRTTLIIVPNMAVAEQWREEAGKHLKEKVANWVAIYKNPAPSSEAIRLHWLMITTMYEVRQQFNHFEENQAMHNGPSVQRSARMSKKSHQLFDIKWYRVILDEAHAIKNIHSKSKEACCSLKAKYRWALTGTPLSNNTTGKAGARYNKPKRILRTTLMCTEFLPYLRFIGCNIVENATKFKQRYVVDERANNHLQGLIATVMYRRFIKSIFKKLAENLEKETTVKIEKANDESIAHLEAQLKEGILKLHFEQYMLLRMVLSHPYNVENLLRTMASGADIQRLRQDLAAIGQKRTVMEQLFEDKELVEQLEPYRSGVERMKKCAKGALGGHVSFDVCLKLMQIEGDAKASTCACDFEQCGQPVLVTQHSQSMEREVWRALRDKNFKEPGIDYNRVSLPRPHERNGCFILGKTRADTSHIPSSRLTVAMCVLTSWVADFPQDKIMVFTQFIATAKMLGLMLQEANIPFLYYYGCMSPSKKAQALDIFRSETTSKMNVLLVSLRAGGQSLNLACANRIIIIDPWWNVTAEQQAIGRAHRLGQNKECHVVRVWTDADMDEKMLSLQKIKSKEIDYALQDDGHIPMLIDDEQREEIFTVTSKNNGNGKQTAARPARQCKRRSKRQDADSSNKANGDRGNKRRKKC